MSMSSVIGYVCPTCFAPRQLVVVVLSHRVQVLPISWRGRQGAGRGSFMCPHQELSKVRGTKQTLVSLARLLPAPTAFLVCWAGLDHPELEDEPQPPSHDAVNHTNSPAPFKNLTPLSTET